MSRLRALTRHPAAPTALLNLSVATFAYLLAFGLRFDFAIPDAYWDRALEALPLLLICKLVGFATFRLFSNWWRHVTVWDVADIGRGNVLASVLFLATMFLLGRLEGFPRSIVVLDLLLCTALMGALRVAIRLARELEERHALRRVDTLVLIVGAGSAGLHLLDEIEHRPRLRLGVVGFVDDDGGKVGLRIAGKPVLGRIDDLPRLIALYEIGEVLIALPSAPGPVLRRAVQQCRAAGVRHRVLPTLDELVAGRVMFTQMREVKLDDILARPPVRFDVPRLRAFISGKRVLITGAAGSIGSELCRQVAAYEPACLILYDRHENGVYALEQDLRTRFPDVRLVPVLGDVVLEDQLRSVFAQQRPETVFHAAAYKHVPLAELNVLEAVRNNVFGTLNVAQAAIEFRAREFVLVSTDKAVRPTSVMGVTKRLAELVIQTLHDGGPRFVAVRFGNVLGSNGSVVPLFREQIARGGPVTVTHPDATRYFMTIPEAVQLILQGAAMGRPGEILILEMGKPVSILELARNMIRLAGFEPDEDIPILFTGLRPGEKLHEELVSEGEEVAPTSHDRIRVLQTCGAPALPEGWIAALHRHVEDGDVAATIALVGRLVPAYQPSDIVVADATRSDAAESSHAVPLAQVA